MRLTFDVWAPDNHVEVRIDRALEVTGTPR